MEYSAAAETLPAGTWGDIESHTSTHDEFGEFWATNRRMTSRLGVASTSRFRRYRPRQTGDRFSRKAVIPSAASSVDRQIVCD